MIGIYHYVALSLLLFGLGVIGVLARKNAIIVLMSVELMLNAANINFLALAGKLILLIRLILKTFAKPLTKKPKQYLQRV